MVTLQNGGFKWTDVFKLLQLPYSFLPPAFCFPQVRTLQSIETLQPIKVQVDYVEVDVVVTDRSGNVVRDLTKDDFQLLEDGKRQTVSTFSMVDIPVERSQSPVYNKRPIDADVITNEQPFDGRIYVLVIDDLHTSAERTQQVRAVGRKFIEEHLGARDLMAVVHTAGPSDASQDLTSNKRLLLAAVDRAIGLGLDSPTVTQTNEYFRRPGNSVSDPAEREQIAAARKTAEYYLKAPTDPAEMERNAVARQTLDYLGRVTEWFAGLRGRKKTILFISEGRQMPDFGLLLDTMQQTIAAATRANVSIYGLDPRAMTQLADETIAVGSFPNDPALVTGQRSISRDIQLSQGFLGTLSDETGAFAVVNTNAFSTAFDRIVRDNSTYYLLAYKPPHAEPGKAHRIDVRVNRPGVTVRSERAM